MKHFHPVGSHIKFINSEKPSDAPFDPIGRIKRHSKYTDHSRLDIDLMSIRNEQAKDFAEIFGTWVPAPITREGEYKSLSNYSVSKRMFPDWFKRFLFDFWDREIYNALGPRAFELKSFEDSIKAIPSTSQQASPGFPWVLAGYVTKERVIREHYEWLRRVYNEVLPTFAYTICPKNELRPTEIGRAHV